MGKSFSGYIGVYYPTLPIKCLKLTLPLQYMSREKEQLVTDQWCVCKVVVNLRVQCVLRPALKLIKKEAI